MYSVNKIVKMLSVLNTGGSLSMVNYELARKIVDTLPVDWSNPHNEICDPACGSGMFLLALAEKLEEYGHSRKHIVTKMLFGYDIDDVQVLTANKTLNMFSGVDSNVELKNTLEEDMKEFDGVVTNPPYNNKGKGTKTTNISGTSLWIEFMDKIPSMLKPNGVAACVVPQAILNTNSVGWKKISDLNVISADTTADNYFTVGTKICSIIFQNKVGDNAKMNINGMKIDRELVPVLPLNVDKTSISIMGKIAQFDSIQWNRSLWDDYSQAKKTKVIAKTFMDRDKDYNFYTRPQMEKRGITNVNLCWIESDNPKHLIKLLKKKLFSFHARQTMFSGNLSIGVMRTLSLPEGWEDIETDDDVYKVYGLTKTEIEYIENVV